MEIQKIFFNSKEAQIFVLNAVGEKSATGNAFRLMKAITVDGNALSFYFPVKTWQ